MPSLLANPMAGNLEALNGEILPTAWYPLVSRMCAPAKQRPCVAAGAFCLPRGRCSQAGTVT